MLFENAFLTLNMLSEEDKNNEYDIVVNGVVNELVDDNELHYIAAAPADHRYSFHGSGLPFANPVQAFMHTQNKGTVSVGPDGSFTIKLRHPNSYYVGLGSKLVPPTITISYHVSGERRVTDVEIAKAIPYRVLTYPRSETYVRNNPMFYKGTDTLPIRTQEQILRDSGYPVKNEMPENFWGLKPRH